MMQKQCSLVFDVGKTNQKLFIFDANFKVLRREQLTLPKTVDEDGQPAEDLEAIVGWMKQSFERLLNEEEFEIDNVNFSAFGATLVHLDCNGIPLTPVYDYHKTISADAFNEFYKNYGPEPVFSSQTGSKNLNLLNSGKQLYWLKYHRKEFFRKIKWSLHLPQYLSYVFTGEKFTEYTSIGCHTDLWDYKKKGYHTWVIAEGIDQLFPKISPTQTTVIKKYRGRKISFGIGIHDSSSALSTYLLKEKSPFILMSTGTWCINFNPFSSHSLFDQKQIEAGAIVYMKTDGEPVLSSRLFLGEEYRLKVDQLTGYYSKPKRYPSGMNIDQEMVRRVYERSKNHFRWRYLDNRYAPKDDDLDFVNFENAYYQLVKELVALLKKHLAIICKQLPQTIYVDGGFSDNKIFLFLLQKEFPKQKIEARAASFACALGAAKIIN